MFANDFLATNQAMYKAIGFDSLRDFTPVACAGTPEAALNRLRSAAAQALAQPDLIERLQKAGYELAPATPEAITAQLRADLERWRRVVNEAKIPRE